MAEKEFCQNSKIRLTADAVCFVKQYIGPVGRLTGSLSASLKMYGSWVG